MALSKQLKEFIEKKYNEQIAKLRAEENKELAEIRAEYNQAAIDVTNEIQTFLTNLKATMSIGVELNSSLLTYAGLDEGCRYYKAAQAKVPDGLAETIRKSYIDKINSKKQEQERLLIRLSLEKNYDSIAAMLREYGIEL